MTATYKDIGVSIAATRSPMATTVNAGARLDRLPVSSFHYRIFWLIGAGMFFDGFDIYLASSVLAATTQTKFSTLPQNLQFISLTLVGMTIGGLVTGFLGDRFGRRFTYQFNLLVFGLASLAAAFAQDMNQLIAWSWRAFPRPRCSATWSSRPSAGGRCSSLPGSARSSCGTCASACPSPRAGSKRRAGRPRPRR